MAQPQKLLYEYASLFHFAEINYSLKVNYASYVLLLLPLLLGDPLYVGDTLVQRPFEASQRLRAHHCQLPADINTRRKEKQKKKHIEDEQRERRVSELFLLNLAL